MHNALNLLEREPKPDLIENATHNPIRFGPKIIGDLIECQLFAAKLHTTISHYIVFKHIVKIIVLN